MTTTAIEASRNSSPMLSGGAAGEARQHDAAEAGEQRAQHIGGKADAVDVDAGEPGGAHVLADGEDAAAIDRAVQHDGASRR